MRGETACIYIWGRGSGHWAGFLSQESRAHSTPFHSIGMKPPHSTWRRLCKATGSSSSPFPLYPLHSHL